MDTLHPFLGPTDAGGRGQAHHRLPPVRAVELLAPKIPFPQPVIRPDRRKRQPFFTSLEERFRVRALGDIVPEYRDATGHGKNADLQNPPARGGRQPKWRQRPGGSLWKRSGDRSRDVGLGQRRHRIDEGTAQRPFARTTEVAVPELAKTALPRA